MTTTAHQQAAAPAAAAPELLPVDVGADWHVQTDLGAGRLSAVGVVDAAQAAGLHIVGICDRVEAGTGWLEEYVLMVRAFARPGITVRCGVETAVLDPGGRLDLPGEFPALDYVVLTLDALPTPDGPVRAEAVAHALAAGETTAEEVADDLVAATVAGLRACPARAVLGRPFGLLTALGIDDAVLTDERIATVAAAVREVGGAVEIGDDAPSARVAGAFAAAGVALLAGSGALDADGVGRFEQLAERAVPRPATPASALQELAAADGTDVAVAVNEELADEVEAVSDGE